MRKQLLSTTAVVVVPDNPTASPALLDLADHPVRMDRRGLAAFITKYFFPVSPRSLERWPLTWQHVNGKAVGTTVQAAAIAEVIDPARVILER